MNRQRPLVQRRFGVRAAAPDAMNRQFALLRAFRNLETRRVTVGALLGVLVVAAIANTTAQARPGLAATIAVAAAATAAFALITFGVAAILRPRRVHRALEAYRWVGRWDWLRWRRITGDDVPRTPAGARAWLETHPASGGAANVPRVEMLVWVGEFDTARRVAYGLTTDRPWDNFERALQIAFVDFVATSDGDLDAARDALSLLDGADRRRAQAVVAVEESRQRAAAGVDFLEPLVQARDTLGAELDRFLLPDLARWVAWPLAVVGLVSTLTTFVVAGALPPR